MKKITIITTVIIALFSCSIKTKPIETGTCTSPLRRKAATTTLLLAALRENKQEQAQQLIRQSGRALVEGGETALTWAIKKNNIPMLRALIASGAPINERNKCGRTALMCAAHTGNLWAVQLLLAAGAHPNDVDPAGETPLLLALTDHHDTAVMEILVHAGACVNHANNDGTTPLMRAVKQGSARATTVLCLHGACVVTIHKDGYPLKSIVELAEKTGNNHVLEFLLRCRIAQLSGESDRARALRSPLKRTELIAASLAGDIRLATSLLEHGANPNQQDITGLSALMAAAMHGHGAIANTLMLFGADHIAQDHGGRSASLIALEHGYPTIAWHINSLAQ